jgi:hypothetical protein
MVSVKRYRRGESPMNFEDVPGVTQREVELLKIVDRSVVEVE